MTEILLRNDKEWSVIDGELCRVKVFTPWARVENGRVIVPSKTEPVGCIYWISCGDGFVFVDESAEQVASSNRRGRGLALRRSPPARVGRL